MLLHRGMGTVLGGLAESGYDAEWDCISAFDVGAPHQRDRIWIVATDTYQISGRLQQECFSRYGDTPLIKPHGSEERVAHTDEKWKLQSEGNEQNKRGWPSNSSEEMAYPKSFIARRLSFGETKALSRSCFNGKDVSNTSSFGQSGQGQSIFWGCRKEIREGQANQLESVSIRDQWVIEPGICRVVDGLSVELYCIRIIEDEFINHKKANAKISEITGQILHYVWEHQELAETSPHLYRNGLRDFMSEVSYADTYSRWLLGKRIAHYKGLRDLWEAFYAKPLQEAYELQQQLLKRIGATQCPKEVASRIDRLSSLGNAVVPQIPELIGKQLKCSC